MPSTFFFDLRRDGSVIVDGQGDELESLGRAEEAAIDFATATARDQFGAGFLDPVIVLVRDAGGHPVFRVTLTFAAERLSGAPH
jgi:hypothetical protein